MLSKRLTRRGRGTLGGALACGAAVAALALPGAALGAAQILPVHEGLADLDARAGSVAPTAAQRSAVSALGARASWTRFGTVGSLIRDGGSLAPGLGAAAATAARSFVRTNRSLFGLSDQGVSNLGLVGDNRLTGTSAHVVPFRQSFGGLPATQDGMIAVGVTGGKVA